MLMPKRVKYRRVHRGRMTGKALRGNSISYGDYAIQALEPCWMTANQIESARRAMTRYIKRGGKIWIKVFPDKPVTKKPAEVRMGSGKGAPEYWVAVVKPGRVLFEMSGVPVDVRKVKLMKIKEIRKMNDSDLQAKLKDLKVELFNLRFQLATGQLENPMRIGGIKKDIARVKTIIRERELNAGKEA